MKMLILILAFANGCVATANEIDRMPVSGSMLTDQEVSFSRSIADIIPEPMLYGGRPVEAGELPMVMNVGFCTVTVVGPEVVHSAGHCHSTGSKASFTYKSVKYTATCTRHPEYNDNSLFNDFALCKFSPKLDMPIYGSLKAIDLAVGDVVIMNGYGRGSSGGRLHVGKLPIARLNGSQEYWTEGSTVLGGGDSGGPLFKDQPDLKTGAFNVVGVNSRAGGQLSIFNRTGHPNAQAFYKSFAEKNSVEICGVTKDCVGGGEEPPPPPPDVPGHCMEEKRMFDLAVNRMKVFEGHLKNCR